MGAVGRVQACGMPDKGQVKECELLPTKLSLDKGMRVGGQVFPQKWMSVSTGVRQIRINAKITTGWQAASGIEVRYNVSE